MTTLEKFRQADKKVTELENNGGVYSNGYGATLTTKEYDKALKEAQELFEILDNQGINPF